MKTINASSRKANFLDRIRVAPQHLLPQHLLTSIIYRLARCRWQLLKNSLINLFITAFKVDMSEAEAGKANDYPHFNAFFTRSIKSALRPLSDDRNIICSPVDGTVSQCGVIEAGSLIQAKNKAYSIDSLLADDSETASLFRDGFFSTLYLSPRDYHRIHMPCDGRLQSMTYVPGDLFAVNGHTARVVSNLFARNERVISLFETDHGPMALIMIGAIFVGSMETVWAGEITPARKRAINKTIYSDKLLLTRGVEMGRFNMGSTVILLFPRDSMQWQENMIAGKPLVMGESIGHYRV